MRIALVSPLFESVPPKLYGGTERIVHVLEGELASMGHDVHVFASGDSATSGTLHASCPRALRLDAGRADYLSPQIVQLERVMDEAPAFDIVHFHTDTLSFPFSRRMAAPNITTLHGRLDLPEQQEIFGEYRDLAFNSISDSQRRPMPFLNWRGTVLHGLPKTRFAPGPGDGGYLAFLGRVSPEKRVDRAIEIARRAGMRLKIAAKIDRADQGYFEGIRHLFDQPHVEFIGEISDAEKGQFLGNAEALLFPIDWPEPFGLVMLEGMACGTPIIAWNHGSVPEVIRPGVNGCIVENMEDAVAAVATARSLSRVGVRLDFERRFSARRMAEDYLKLYGRLIAAHPRSSVRRITEVALDAS